MKLERACQWHSERCGRSATATAGAAARMPTTSFNPNPSHYYVSVSTSHILDSWILGSDHLQTSNGSLGSFNSEMSGTASKGYCLWPWKPMAEYRPVDPKHQLMLLGHPHNWPRPHHTNATVLPDHESLIYRPCSGHIFFYHSRGYARCIRVIDPGWPPGRYHSHQLSWPSWSPTENIHVASDL